jgi:hypothetical protein
MLGTLILLAVAMALSLYAVHELAPEGWATGLYLVDYPRYSSGWWNWQWGAQPIVAYFEAHSAAYDHEYMNAESNAPDELLRFYTTPEAALCRLR